MSSPALGPGCKKQDEEFQIERLKGKVAVVTGASRGVCRHIAKRLARDGAAVALLARTEAGLEATRNMLANNGALAFVVPVDVADPESLDRVKDIIERDPAIWIETIMINGANER